MARGTTDDYQWVAHYADGTRVPEYVDGVARGWRDVAHARVVALSLIPTDPNQDVIRLELPQGAMPVLFRRRSVTVAYQDGWPVTSRETITVIGWESATASHYLAVSANGDVHATPDREAL